ncbi:hypothetical protein DRQ33_07640 [bacterium]|nr:MAG: hypothetical protein DRQ33_07640 [bacterium]
MKKILFVIFIIAFVIDITCGAGTYRIFTNQSGPLDPDSDWMVERVDPHSGPKYAQAVPQFGYWNDWDAIMGGHGERPVPWERMYEREDAHWISWTEYGRDSYTPDPEDPETWKYYWYYSPAFKMYDNISRATIWIAADDGVVSARLRNVTTEDTYSLGISMTGYNRLRRFDVTDLFRARSEGSTDPPYQMEFFVVNSNIQPTGIIVYMSYDYEEAEGEPTDFTYMHQPTGLEDWYYTSMPFFAEDEDATLSSLFPDIEAAQIYDSETNVWRAIDIDRSLTGTFGDTMRTYTFGIMYEHGWLHTPTISGYPIYEQRYLDFVNNNSLYLGSVDCNISFSGSDAEDTPDEKILSTYTSYYWGTILGPGWYHPTPTVRPQYGHSTRPRNFTPPDYDYSLPYSLDIYCNEDWLDCGEDELKPPVIFEHSEEEVEELIELSKSLPLPPDTAEIRAYLEELDRRSMLPPDPSGIPHEENAEFGKRSQQIGNASSEFHISTYPSPFNSQLFISINIPNDDNVTINIYDISGNLIRNIYSGSISMGMHHFKWNGENNRGKTMPNGIYFIRVDSFRITAQSRVILMK